jgi:hypothetical protein
MYVSMYDVVDVDGHNLLSNWTKDALNVGFLSSILKEPLRNLWK